MPDFGPLSAQFLFLELLSVDGVWAAPTYPLANSTEEHLLFPRLHLAQFLLFWGWITCIDLVLAGGAHRPCGEGREIRPGAHTFFGGEEAQILLFPLLGLLATSSRKATVARCG